MCSGLLAWQIVQKYFFFLLAPAGHFSLKGQQTGNAAKFTFQENHTGDVVPVHAFKY